MSNGFKQFLRGFISVFCAFILFVMLSRMIPQGAEIVGLLLFLSNLVVCVFAIAVIFHTLKGFFQPVSNADTQNSLFTMSFVVPSVLVYYFLIKYLETSQKTVYTGMYSVGATQPISTAAGSRFSVVIWTLLTFVIYSLIYNTAAPKIVKILLAMVFSAFPLLLIFGVLPSI